MHLIVGLGNPGIQYALTRHNFGFMVLDELSEMLKIKFAPGKENYFIGEGSYHSKKVILAKPTTYMNNSGYAVKNLINKFQVNLSKLIIVVDDLHLKLGTIRLRMKGSDGGNKGLKSIINLLHTQQFPRLRLGTKTDIIDNHVEFVLSEFSKEEIPIVKTVISRAIEALCTWIDEGIYKAMDKFNNYQINTETVNS